MPQTLQLILVLLGAAVVVVVVCRLIRLPPILGYLVVGLGVGPHALALVPNTENVRDLAEFGIVFLMFSIGLEFSLPQLKAMRRAVFGLGLAQVAITTAAAMLVLYLAGWGWQTGLALGGALAMSSTAIVSKMLAERMELGSAHGRDVMSILLFQDLAVVAFLIVLPTLGKSGGEVATDLGVAALKAAVALGLILFAGQRPMRAWFHVIARQKSAELFMLNVLLVTLGLAAITELAGLSLALGAFLAGMLIAETEYRYQVEEDIKPFRDVLLGLFFVTVGMLLDPAQVAAHWGWVLLLLAGSVGGKLVLIVALSRLFGASPGTALRTGFYLAQAGEFSLVMLALAADGKILGPPVTQIALAAMILSMLGAPVIIHFAEPIVRRFTANDWLARAAQVTRIAASTMARQRPRDHLRLRAERPEPHATSRGGRRPVHRARLRPGAGARGRCRRRQRRIRGCATARGVDRGGAREGEGDRHHVQRHGGGAQDPASRASGPARPAGDRPHAGRQRDRDIADGRRDRSRARGARRQPDARDAFAARAGRAAQPRADADARRSARSATASSAASSTVRRTPPTPRTTCSRGSARCCCPTARTLWARSLSSLGIDRAGSR